MVMMHFRIFLSLFLLLAIGCEKEAAPVSKPIQQLHILTPSAWWLKINADGSAELGYTTNSPEIAKLAAGSFDAENVLSRLEPTLASSGNMAEQFAVIIRRPNDKAIVTRYTTDSGFISALFEKARASAEAPTPRLAELWKQTPPIPREEDPNLPRSISPQTQPAR